MKIDVTDLIFTGRGSSALWAVLKSLDMANAKVLLPVNICEIIYPIVIKAGFEPIFYDVDSVTGNARLDNIEDSFTGEETVLIVVHNFGAPLEISEISKWAKKNNLFLIEDVCNAIGATYQGKPLGIFGDASFFSFGYAKMIEYGVGGAAFIRDTALTSAVKRRIASLDEYSDTHKSKDMEYQRRLREIRQTTGTQTPATYLPLYKEYSEYLLYRIDLKTENEIRELLNHLDNSIAERARKALRYRNEITSTRVMHINEIPGQVYWRYNIRVESEIRDDLIMELRKNNILASTWFLPIVELFESDIDMGKYSGSRTFGNQVINLFVDHRVSQNDISKAIGVINNF